jgi:molybdopterin-biosynthesis enzyme MoeA-like protein
MKTEIIPVGTEILLGNIVDTNSSFLANQLPLLGIDLYFISTAGDNQEVSGHLKTSLEEGRPDYHSQGDWDPLKMILPERPLA